MIKIPFDQLQDAIESGEYIGFCLHCGEEYTGIEPDAEGYTCENCERDAVYGAEEILIMGAYED